ncbi:hypothetical protein WICPIJ_003083, partial [Wickerhamomyces pijperi]
FNWDIEDTSNFISGLTSNHFSNGFTTRIQQRSNVQVVSSQDDFVQHFVINIVQEGLVPVIQRSRLSGIFIVIIWESGVFVMFTPFNDLLQGGALDVW